MGLRPALAAVTKLGVVANFSHVCSKSICNKWVQEMTFKCLHCVSSWFYLCVKYTVSEKLYLKLRSVVSEYICVLLGPPSRAWCWQESTAQRGWGFIVTLSIQSVDLLAVLPIAKQLRPVSSFRTGAVMGLHVSVNHCQLQWHDQEGQCSVPLCSMRLSMLGRIHPSVLLWGITWLLPLPASFGIS